MVGVLSLPEIRKGFLILEEGLKTVNLDFDLWEEYL